MSTIIRKIGLEAEYLLRDTSGALVYPGSHGLDHDSFPILGEVRGEPGATRAEAIANFLKAYYETVFKVKSAKLTLDLSGWAGMTPAAHAEAVRKQEMKEVAKCLNIHGTDILERSDAKIIKGKVVEQRVGCGLHVHFSADVEAFVDATPNGIALTKKELAAVFGTEKERGELYAKLLNQIENEEYDDADDGAPKGKKAVSVSQLCKPAVEMIVKSMDKVLLPSCVKGLPDLKYRLPGFYEIKSYGFEYRSLPFTKQVFGALDEIVAHSFDLLEAL